MTERPHRIVVVGAGDVGLVTAVGLASMGYRVEVVETPPDRPAARRAGRSPIQEAGRPEEPPQPSVRGSHSPGTVRPDPYERLFERVTKSRRT